MNSSSVILPAILTAVLAASPAVGRDLTVVSWGGSLQDAQKEVYFRPFVAKTGIPMNDESWDGGVGVLRAKVEGGALNWDVVEVESEELALGCEEGLYEKIDYAKIGGKDSYLPEAVNECGVGTILYDFVLAYDGDKLKAGPQSWADFWDLKKFPGLRALRQGPKTTLEIALMADGVAPKDVYAVLATDAGVERAFVKLKTIRDHLVFWKAGAQPPQLLASGEVVMTSAYNGRITAANDKDHKNFRMSWNGALFTLDSWVILKGSPNNDLALKFLDFVGKPEYQRLLPNYIAYGPTSKAAMAMVDPKMAERLGTEPENMARAVQISDAFWAENIDRLTERFNTWVAE